jgi:hypothetical protein
MGQGPNEIRFFEYCTAFKAIDPDIMDNLCRALDTSEDNWTPMMFRDKPGDGYVLVPSYKGVLGKRQIVSWQTLNQDGEIHIGVGEDAQFTERVDEIVAQYFIAGAFGIGELSGGVVLDAQILRGIKELYAACGKDSKKCLETATARRVALKWQSVQTELSEKEDLAEIIPRVKKLEEQLRMLIARTDNKSELEGKVAAYRLAMPRNPTTIKEYKKAEELYMQMIGIAEMNLSEATTQRGILHYTTEAARLAEEIGRQEPFLRSRFTDALEAGLRCMPMGQTLQERYCVARNKYEMAVWILDRLNKFRSNPCLERDLIDMSYERADGRTQLSYLRPCIKSEYSDQYFDSDDLIQTAKRHCSTHCQ